jgi:hypothetical protein
MPVAYPREGTGGRVPLEFGEEVTPIYLSPQILGRHRAIEYSATFDDAIKAYFNLTCSSKLYTHHLMIMICWKTGLKCYWSTTLICKHLLPTATIETYSILQ